ncbi:hypothetical protein [Micromonospora qiuiae]|uniref:hypothetical protein n=1 Tax=Micromonospora qiuiae TaxID=502268 RepID=UPI0019525E11|nr:hypothetical protein [Micromonospora qiuiae]
MLQLYPTSLLVLVPYGVLVVPMALLNGNPELWFIVKLLLLALAGTVVIELATARWLGKRSDWQSGLARANAGYPHLYLLARATTIVSIIADLIGGLAGRGSIFAQVSGEVNVSPAVVLTSLFSGWRYLAFVLLLASLLGGQARRLGVLWWTTALLATQVVLVLMTAFSSPLISYLSFILGVGAICGVIRPRLVVVAAVALFMAWPTLYSARNDVRTEGGVKVSEEVTAAERIRFDLQLTRASAYDVPAAVDHPGLPGIVRYGLLPRALDAERPPLTTGTRINEYLGGSSHSAYNFLTLGTVYFLEGPWGVVLFYGGWALVVVLLLRTGGTPGPVRLSLFGFAVAGPLIWTRTYPENVVGFLQHTVAALPILLVLFLLRPRERSAPSGSRVAADRFDT